MAKATEILKARPADVVPKIYAFSIDHPEFEGWLKVGYTTLPDVEQRVQQAVAAVKLPDRKKRYFRIELEESAMREDGTSFMDHEVHRILECQGIQRGEGEWFLTDVETVRAAVVAARNRTGFVAERTADFGMRREQVEAVERTAEYFKEARRRNRGKPARFLWNAKMRFGKTFATYQLAKKMGMKRILVLTFKPAVESAWEEDLRTHVDFEG